MKLKPLVNSLVKWERATVVLVLVEVMDWTCEVVMVEVVLGILVNRGRCCGHWVVKCCHRALECHPPWAKSLAKRSVSTSICIT